MCSCLSRRPYWDLAHNPGMCPDQEWNWQPLVRRSTLNPLTHTIQSYHDVFNLLFNSVLPRARDTPGVSINTHRHLGSLP